MACGEKLSPRIALRLAASANRHSGATHPWLRRVPRRLRGASIARGMLAALVIDARQDFGIWRNKTYIDRPPLARGDGPIGNTGAGQRGSMPKPAPSNGPLRDTCAGLGSPPHTRRQRSIASRSAPQLSDRVC